MVYRKLGKWGIKLSAIGLGSWYTFGSSVSEAESIAVIRASHEAGVNLFDTANVYSRQWRSGAGEAEIILGKALKDLPRSSCVILTKVRGQMGKGPNDRGLSAKHIKQQCEGSLRRLCVDHIDIYMCHGPDPSTPLEETIRAMDDLARAGKILYWGAEWATWRIMKAQGIARQMNAPCIAAIEHRYNLLYRYPELELFEATRDEGIGHLAFSPLAQGMLTGKYPPGEPAPPESRGADEHDGKYMRKLYFSEENKLRCRELADIAAEVGLRPSQLALAWVLKNEQVTSAIIGARTIEQVRENAVAAEVVIPQDILERLEQLFPARNDRWIGEAEIPTLV